MTSINQSQTKKQVPASNGGFFWTDVTTTECELRSNGRVTKFNAKIFIPINPNEFIPVDGEAIERWRLNLENNRLVKRRFINGDWT